MNWIGILLAAASSLAIGFIWYNPKTLGTIWMNEIGMTATKMRSGNMALRYGLTFLMAFFVAVFIYANTYGHEEKVISSLRHGTYHGTLIAAIVAAPMVIINALFEQMSFKAIAINVGYWIVTMAVMGAIIGAMGHV